MIKYPVEENPLRQGCLAPKMKMWQGMEENLAKFYVASIVLALEYLHDNNLVFRWVGGIMGWIANQVVLNL